MQDDPSSQVTASISDGSMTLRMNTRYGPVTFSYSPQAVEAGLSELVSEVLDQVAKSDPMLLTRLSSESDLPLETVKESFDVYRQRQNARFPDDAIEKFTPGNRAYVQGTLEQFAEGIAPGIALMLDHLAVTSLTRNVSDLDHAWEGTVDKSSLELRGVLSDHFRRAIHDLWDRRSGNSGQPLDQK
jgi:hypothetical protein